MERLKQQYQFEMFYKNKRRTQRNELITTGLTIGAALVASLVVQVVLVLILEFASLRTVYDSSSLFQNAFNIVAVDICSLLVPFLLMSIILKNRREGDLIPRKPVGKVPMLAWICLGMGGCVGASYVAALVIALFKQFGYKLTQSEYNDPTNILECVMIVFSTAIAPAIFEEFAMRCCALGVLKKYGKGFAVFAVSIVFGLIHQNVIQFVFAFLVGLILGYITVVTDSVVPAMLIHGANNMISVIDTILKFAEADNISKYFSTVIYAVWIALAVWGAIYLIIKKKLIPKRQKRLKEPYELSFGAKILCLVPGFFIPFVAMIYFTTFTIVPIK